MRNAEEIYEETRSECIKDNCQSLNVVTILSIEKAQKEMFYYLYQLAEENEKLSLVEFFDKVEKEISFKL
jgi:hypothetical protein